MVPGLDLESAADGQSEEDQEGHRFAWFLLPTPKMAMKVLGYLVHQQPKRKLSQAGNEKSAS